MLLMVGNDWDSYHATKAFSDVVITNPDRESE